MKSAFVKFFLSPSETSPPNLSTSFMISAFVNCFHQLSGRWLASGAPGSGFFLFWEAVRGLGGSFSFSAFVVGWSLLLLVVCTFGLAFDFTAVALFVALASSFTSFCSSTPARSSFSFFTYHPGVLLRSPLVFGLPVVSVVTDGFASRLTGAVFVFARPLVGGSLLLLRSPFGGGGGGGGRASSLISFLILPLPVVAARVGGSLLLLRSPLAFGLPVVSVVTAGAAGGGGGGAKPSCLTSRFTGVARALDRPLVVTDAGTGVVAGPSIPPAGFALAFGVALGSTSFSDLALSLRLGLPVVSVVTAPAAGGGGGGGPVLLLV